MCQSAVFSMSSVQWIVGEYYPPVCRRRITHTVFIWTVIIQWNSESPPDMNLYSPLLPNCTWMICSFFQLNLKAYVLLMICLFLSLFFLMALKILSGIFSISSQSAKWELPLKHLLSIVGLRDEFGSRFEKKSWIYNLCGRDWRQRQLTEWNPSRCCNGYNYTKKGAVRLNYPWYSPWIMAEIQKVKWHQ